MRPGTGNLNGLHLIGLVNPVAEGGFGCGCFPGFVDDFSRGLRKLLRRRKGRGSIGASPHRRLRCCTARHGRNALRDRRKRARRQLGFDQSQEFGEAARVTGLYESGAACFRNPVDDREPRVDAGAVPGIDAAVDGGGEPEGGRAGEIGIERPDVRVQGIVGCSRQNHEAAAIGHAAQGRADMADGRVAHAPLDIGRRGEGRIHQHANRRDARVEIIVDLLGVEAGDRRLRKQRRKHGVASFGEFVERERGSRDFGMDGKKSGARRRLEHDLSGAHLRGEA